MEIAAVLLLAGCVCWCAGQLACWWCEEAGMTPADAGMPSRAGGGHGQRTSTGGIADDLPAEHQPLLGSSTLQQPQQRTQQLRVYPQRFWIAFLWSWFGVVGAFAWNLYAPIAQPMKQLYGWDGDIIDWMTNSNNLAFVITAPAWAWFADSHGLRPATLLATSFLLVAGALNLLLLVPTFPRQLSWLPAIGSEILNGAVVRDVPFTQRRVGSIANHLCECHCWLLVCALRAADMRPAEQAPLQNFGPPLVSATWFPPHERTTVRAPPLYAVVRLLDLWLGFADAAPAHAEIELRVVVTTAR